MNAVQSPMADVEQNLFTTMAPASMPCINFQRSLSEPVGANPATDQHENPDNKTHCPVG